MERAATIIKKGLALYTLGVIAVGVVLTGYVTAISVKVILNFIS